MILRAAFAATILSAGVVALAACGGNNAVTYPTPGPTCAPPGATAYQLIYPAPGSSNVAVTTQQIVIALNTPLPNYTWGLALNASGTTYYTANSLAPIAASQLPPGSATTTITNPTYEALQLISQLPADTSISVSLNNATTTCTPLAIPNATFTTEQ